MYEEPVAPAMSDAAGAVGVAALPLVLELERAGAVPRAGAGGQRRAVLGGAGEHRRGRWETGGAGSITALGALVAVCVPASFVAVTTACDDVADVVRAERVRGAGRAGDVDAVGAVGVAALPLVRRSRTGRCRPRCPGRRSASRRPPSCPTRPGRPCSTGGAAATTAVGTVVTSRRARVVGRGHDGLHDVADVAGAERVGRAGLAGDVDAAAAVGVAALPLVRRSRTARCRPRCRSRR